jgi:hypothetical protein
MPTGSASCLLFEYARGKRGRREEEQGRRRGREYPLTLEVVYNAIFQNEKSFFPTSEYVTWNEFKQKAKKKIRKYLLSLEIRFCWGYPKKQMEAVKIC